MKKMPSFTPISYEILVAIPGFQERFWDKVDRTEQVGDCWAWCGNRIYTGYGHIRAGNKLLLAHRVALVLDQKIEQLATDKLVIHSCDFRPCCRPEHLRIGTHGDNNADTKLRNRGNTLRGFDNPNTKVTVEMLRAIRAATGSQSEIGRAFGLTQSHVSKILLGQIWKHVV